MWEADQPSSSASLRQGDLLLDVPIVAQQTDAPPGESLSLRVERKNFVVVSQCCTTENHGVVSLARVQTMRASGISPRFLESLQVRPPVPRESGITIATNYFLLDPYPLAVEPGRLKVANFLDIRTVLADPAAGWLTSRRAASMSVTGRRDLRSRLGLFWARPTQEDEAALLEAGEPLHVEPYSGARALREP